MTVGERHGGGGAGTGQVGRGQGPERRKVVGRGGIQGLGYKKAVGGAVKRRGVVYMFGGRGLEVEA
jgi:hypothetical protein